MPPSKPRRPFAVALGSILVLVLLSACSSPGTTDKASLSIQVGGSGTGTVSGPGINCGSDCAEVYAQGATVTLTATPAGVARFSGWGGDCSGTGDCVLTLNDDANVTATFAQSASPPGSILSLSQTHHFATGCLAGSDCEPAAQLSVPSIDPAAVAFHPPSNSLFIADSEIEEISARDPSDPTSHNVGATLFQASLTGDTLLNSWNLPDFNSNNKEPTGIAFCPDDGHFYITNDENGRIYRYPFSGGTLSAASTFASTGSGSDPEGIACDPAAGRLYVINGKEISILVYSYRPNLALLDTLDLFMTAGDPAGVPSDPEGITFDPVTGHLLVVSTPDAAVFEYTLEGGFVQKFDISGFSPRPLAPQGLSLGPASDGSGESLYIADGGVDNSDDPEERDGVIYEAKLGRRP